MKAIILLFSFVSFLCLISCGKTDSDSKPTTTPITQTPPANTPTASTPENQKTSIRPGQDRHPPLVCNIQNYKDFIKKPGVHNCNLYGAYLRWENFQATNLVGADLRWANLQRAYFGEGANLTGAKLQGAKLQEAKLRGANLTGATIIIIKTLDLYPYLVIET